MTTHLEAALTGDEYAVRIVSLGQETKRLGGNRYQWSADSPDASERLREILGLGGNLRVGAIVNLLGIASDPEKEATDSQLALSLCQTLLCAVQTTVDDLVASAEQGGGILLNLVSIDGEFGLQGADRATVIQSASIGFFKSVQREYPKLHVLNLDLDPALDSQEILLHLSEAVEHFPGELEVGCSADGRRCLQIADAPAETDPSHFPLDANSVVLVTGGAAGVTAECVAHLSERSKATFILVGRSPLPGEEDPELTGCEDATALRKALIAQPINRPPAEIERQVKRVLRAREIRETLRRIEASGGRWEYHAIDVTADQAVSELCDSIYERFGRLDGVIHGAGVIEDRRIRDKSPDSFARVFRTKVDGALALLKAVQPQTLRFMVFFSSVSGRFGNAGQADYAAANEVLNKLAAHYNTKWPGRVVAINWGPWDGGMVNDVLRKAYAERGIGLIPRAGGARAMANELELGPNGAAEVILGCGLRAMEQASIEKGVQV